MFAALALMTKPMPSVRAFCLNEPSDLFINFEIFGDRRAGFRMGLKQLHIVLRILFALARSLLRHFMFSKMVVRLSKERPQLAER
jgi:hypothetical protein